MSNNPDDLQYKCVIGFYNTVYKDFKWSDCAVLTLLYYNVQSPTQTYLWTTPQTAFIITTVPKHI